MFFFLQTRPSMACRSEASDPSGPISMIIKYSEKKRQLSKVNCMKEENEYTKQKKKALKKYFTKN